MYEIGMKIRADMKKRRGGEPYMVTLTQHSGGGLDWKSYGFMI
jgi:hypothetical protein